MPDPFQNFLGQYKENCNTYVRRAPVRLLGLVLAFPVAIGLASVGALLSRLTGEPLAAGVVIFVGAIAYLVGWIVVARMLDRPRQAPQPLYPPAPYAQSPFPPPGAVSPYAAAPLAAPPVYPPSHGEPQFATPVTAELWQQPMPPQPARSGSGGCVVAALGTLAILVLSCCGGGIFLSRFAPHAGPANQPFQAGGPFPGDPFADMQRQQQQQQRQLDDMLQRQRDQMRQFGRDQQRLGQGPGW